MKRTPDKIRAQKLADELQMARLRLARVASELKSCEEQLRIARRRRKEAKAAIRRVKSRRKLIKANVSDATQSLADAETRWLKAGERAIKTKNRRGKSPPKPKTSNRAASPSRKPGAPTPTRHANSVALVPSDDADENAPTVIAANFEASSGIGGSPTKLAALGGFNAILRLP